MCYDWISFKFPSLKLEYRANLNNLLFAVGSRLVSHLYIWLLVWGRVCRRHITFSRAPIYTHIVEFSVVLCFRYTILVYICFGPNKIKHRRIAAPHVMHISCIKGEYVYVYVFTYITIYGSLICQIDSCRIGGCRRCTMKKIHTSIPDLSFRHI